MRAILVKSVAFPDSTHQINVSLLQAEALTVRGLKELIQATFPGSPSVHSQRIIFQGKLLDDAQLASETLFAVSDEADFKPVIHLVLKDLVNPASRENSRGDSGLTSDADSELDNSAAHRRDGRSSMHLGGRSAALNGDFNRQMVSSPFLVNPNQCQVVLIK